VSVSQIFESFAAALQLPTAKKQSISSRTAKITRRLNKDFRETDSDTANRFYGGSYGRNTAVDSLSDVDLLYVLPYSVYVQYNALTSGKQSALLRAVKESLLKTYQGSNIFVDSQIVKIPYTDGITFEVVPVFRNTDGSYTYADTSNGGSWQVCKPKQEIDAFVERNKATNMNLVVLGRMVRAWRDKNSVGMSGMLIDTLAWQFIEDWAHKDKSYLYHDYLTRDFFKWLSERDKIQTYWRVPGSGAYAYKGGPFHAKAETAYDSALAAIKNLEGNEFWAARQKYRSIYGTGFPE
jgi:hypothetical protein